MRILGIESSCDETAAAVVESPLHVRSNVIASQIASHQPYGGVVPELAAREHVQALPWVLQHAVEEAGLDWLDLDGIAVTQGPGLSSALLSGLTAGWGLARRLGLPFYPVHHLEGHLLSTLLAEDEGDPMSRCPALVLLVTGGHTALLRMNAPGEYVLLGRSIDDAAGEALDKGARLLGLPYPGGPMIEREAEAAQVREIRFPKGIPDGEEAQRRGGRFPFSFSGLKTALRYHRRDDPEIPVAEVAFGYQEAVMGTLLHRLTQALEQEEGVAALACVGGVAHNRTLRAGMSALADQAGVPFVQVPDAYCTDNAAMIATVPLLRRVEPANVFPAADPNLALQGMQLRGA